MLLEEIFEIVSKMNPKEKSYFLRFAKRYSNNSKDRNYLILYNKINDQVKKNKIDIQSVLVGIPANKFDNYKQHLHKTLLKSLSYYYLPKNKEKKLVYGIHTIKWLMEKGVVSTAVRLLKKLKKESLKEESFETLLSIHTLEMSMLQYEDLENQLTIIQAEIKDTMDKYKVYSNYLSLSKQCMNLHRKDFFLPNGDKKLMYYNSHPLLQKEVIPNSKKSTFLFLSIKSTLAYIERDYFKSYFYFKKLVDILQKDNFKSMPSFDALHNIMITCIYTEKKEEFWIYSQHLKRLCEQSKNDYTHILFKKVTLKYYRAFGEYTEGMDLIIKSKIIDKNPNSLSAMESSFLIEAYFFCVSAKKFQEAMTYLNHWYSSAGPKLTPKYKFVARVLEVVIHLELKNDLLAQNLMESLLQSFRLKKTYYTFEKIMINYFKNALKYSTQANKLKLILVDTINSISSLDKTKENVFWLDFFDFQFFFEQKLEQLK
jgi:hypothetical protein